MSRVVSWFSCGAASAVATKLMLSDNPDMIIAYCEVREEHPDNKRFLKDCEEWFGKKILVMGNDEYKRSIDEVFWRRKYMSGVAGAPCTSLLKKSIREEFEKPDDIQVFGYTCEEQGRVDRFIDQNPDVNIATPLLDRGLTKSDCLAMVQDAGIELPEMYKLGYKNNNPCTLDTEVVTSSGVFPIGDLIGKDIIVFNRSGWCSAFVTAMGEQPVIKLEVSRKGLSPKTLRFTRDHKWYQVSRRGHLKNLETKDIRVGDFLPMISNTDLSHTLSKEWFTRGFCVGDGSINGKHSCIRIFNEKMKAFDRAGIKYSIRKDGVGYIGLLPKDYKSSFPIIGNNSKDEIISFLAGWLASDGSCNKLSSICIATADHKAELIKLLSSLAIFPSRIEERMKTEGFNRNKEGREIIQRKPLHVVYFRASLELLYKPSHRSNYSSPDQRMCGWKVDKITQEDSIDVACVTVEKGDPEWVMPTGILTGNCMGCVKAASVAYWKKIAIDFPKRFRVMAGMELITGARLCKYTVDGKEHRVSLLELPDHIEPMDDTTDIQCGIFCQMTKDEYD